MRKLVTHFTITALTFCLGLSKPAFAQIVNGDFETQYPNTPPSVEDNIQPNNSGVDQLPNWSVPLQVTQTSYGTIGTFAGFEAANAALATGMNPAQPFYYATFPSAPHNNSTGRVGIKRSSIPGDFQNDGMIMQQVTLTPGHQYQVSFWALKTSYAQYKSKMAFSVVNSSSAPMFDHRQSVNSLVPAPYQVITSNYITDTNDWTQVTGTFTASALPSGTNTWVVVGFDRSASTFDASIGNPGSGSNSNYVIDDVAVTDLTCANNPAVAGPNQTICPNTSAVIGQGCLPVGATSQWRIQGSSTVFATSLQTAVTPASTTTYELTVTQANGTVSTTQTTVTVFDPNNFTPQLSLLVDDNCYGLYLYAITNYNSAYTYTVQVINGFSGATGVNPGMRGGAGTFELARAKKASSGSFTVTVNYAACGGHTATSAVTTKSFPTFPACRQAAAIQDTDTELAVAYPNPATESLTVPDGVQRATLLNSAGKPVQSLDKPGKLNVQSLPEGLYNLQMMQNGKLINQRIQVRH